jgi:hypothetical protein
VITLSSQNSQSKVKVKKRASRNPKLLSFQNVFIDEQRVMTAIKIIFQLALARILKLQYSSQLRPNQSFKTAIDAPKTSES